MGMFGSGQFGVDPRTQAALQQMLGQQGGGFNPRQTFGDGTTVNGAMSLGQPATGQSPSMGVGQYAAPQDSQYAPPPAPQNKGGFFGHGFGQVIGQALNGALDGVSTHFGGQPVHAMALQREADQADELRKMMRQAEMAAQARRETFADGREAHRMDRETDLANPAPSEDTFTRSLAAAGIQPGSAEYIALARKRAEMLTQPMQFVSDGMGGGNYTHAPGAAPDAGSNTPHITDPSQLHSLPPGSQFMAPDGTLRTVPGGAGGNASGGFRP